MLIAAIVLVRAIMLYRPPKASFLALWGIAVARLLIPFSLTSRWSVYNLFSIEGRMWSIQQSKA